MGRCHFELAFHSGESGALGQNYDPKRIRARLGGHVEAKYLLDTVAAHNRQHLLGSLLVQSHTRVSIRDICFDVECGRGHPSVALVRKGG